ncbi:S41 family peptidase [Sphingomonas carotinifaciens]|uniref:Carboxyl-terminal processing protease n=1 Tax=Sphingomonas carotinifaciens TaxID=1166323 RepID=A0A1G7KZT2_9SPHN|nr:MULTISPECIES: S41 family peptidase [Sphingomonas]MBB4085472.1 carboxyl-terminal processing protease [Sphingomonas carotinifaciens]MWC43505.1 PDZ domain-containing protein [Sphingomonas carotinifaciens]SDF42651.1 carboxyl-terminal processing protease [Sphingomonas carotinifaciens]
MPRPLLTATAIVGTLAMVPLATAAMAAVDSGTYREFDQFLEVYNRVKADYVDKVDDKTLIKGAIQGMLAALDPHSSYVDALDFDNLKIQTEGNYGGLGLTVSMEDGAVKVIAPQEDTPAGRAGIKSGDYITHIDGKLIYGQSLDEAIGVMRGKPGTKIALTLVRPGRDKPLEVTLVREVIVQRPVKWEVRGDVGYININTFSENTGADTRAAIMAIDKSLGHRPLGYVVDLRDNGGGLLTQAIAVSDAFLERGEIVSQRGREKSDIERYYAKAGDDAHGLPVIVLTNSGTASASEIVAGALQDHHRAIVMGERTFGKGSVQTLLPLGPETALRLTTARYYTPSGRSVQEGGIEPDLAVPQISDPDYKSRPVFREADLRRHLINEVKADDKILEEDTKTDPRFAATPDSLKKQGIEDFQLYYALKTIARLGGATQVAAATKPPVK